MVVTMGFGPINLGSNPSPGATIVRDIRGDNTSLLIKSDKFAKRNDCIR